LDLVALAFLLISARYLERVRRSLALALVIGIVAACSGGDRSNRPATRTASSADSAAGAGGLLLRVPRTGGLARVVGYPNSDSALWTTNVEVPQLERVLAFDADAGLIAAVDSRGLPVWLDLRTGAVATTGRGKLHDAVSVDGSTIYGVGSDGAVARFTPAGNWLFKPPAAARSVFPQSNGTLIILGGRGAGARLWRIHPPETKILDSLVVRDAVMGSSAPLADKLYIAATDGTVLGVRVRRLAQTRSVAFEHSITDMSATPSGNRFYVIADSSNTVSAIDQYQDRVTATIELPGRPRDLRVDPFGRLLLVRAAGRDSVWVISMGTDRMLGTVRSVWRGDVPFVAPDGALALANGRDLVFVDPTTLREVRRITDGASEFWYPFVWTGFRARAATLDQPVQLPTDSGVTTASPTPPVRDTTAVAPPATPVDSSKLGFMVSFAALLNEAAARAQAAKITVEGHTARVVTGTSSGVTVFRVVLGPYPTREEADRVGRASGQSYYVFAGTP
jgi:YVTN family beta-propeller protein